MTTTDTMVLRSPLGVLAAATSTHDTGRDDDIALPKLPGFVESAFSPLAYEVSRRCLTERPGDGARTAVALAALTGDTTTADLASRLHGVRAGAQPVAVHAGHRQLRTGPHES